MQVGRFFTIGHSTRASEDFLALLAEQGVNLLVDVRRYPASRRHPQFNSAVLAESLARAQIGYLHLESLGGRRSPRPNSPNSYWQSASFRGYADYLSTPAFQSGLAQLVAVAATQVPALMCAEAVPWNCHRQLIADILVACGHEVVHILGPGQTRTHELNPQARRSGDTLIYPAAQQSLFDS